jgi:hypothetical protein
MFGNSPFLRRKTATPSKTVRKPLRSTGTEPGQPETRPTPISAPEKGLKRHIFGTVSRRNRPNGAQINLLPKQATDFLANSAENVYRIGQTEVKMGFIGRYSETGKSPTERWPVSRSPCDSTHPLWGRSAISPGPRWADDR